MYELPKPQICSGWPHIKVIPVKKLSSDLEPEENNDYRYYLGPITTVRGLYTLHHTSITPIKM